MEEGLTSDDAMYCGEPWAPLLETGPRGLSQAEAQNRILRFGRNALEDKKSHPLLKLAKNFVSPMAMMIWAAVGTQRTVQTKHDPQKRERR